MAMAVADRQGRVFGEQFVLGLAICSLFNVVFNLLLPGLPMYTALQGAQDWEVGLVMGAYGVAALFMRPLSGRLTDQLGARRVMLAGIVLFAIPSVLYAAVHSIPLLFVLRFLQGAGMVSFFTSSTALIINPLPPARMSEGIGYLGVFTILGGAAAPLAVWLIEVTDFTVFFWTCGILGVMCFFIGLKMKPWRAPRPAGDGEMPRLPLINRRALFPSLVYLSFTLTIGAVSAFLPLFAMQRGLGNPGLFLAAQGMAGMVTRLFLSRISDRFGRITIIVSSMVIAALTMWLLAVSVNQLMFIISGVLFGIALGGAYVELMAFTLDRVPPETRGSAIATFQWAFDIGSSGGAIALGFIASMVNYAAVFAVAGVSPIVGLASFVVVCRRTARSPQLSPD